MSWANPIQMNTLLKSSAEVAEDFDTIYTSFEAGYSSVSQIKTRRNIDVVEQCTQSQIN